MKGNKHPKGKNILYNLDTPKAVNVTKRKITFDFYSGNTIKNALGTEENTLTPMYDARKFSPNFVLYSVASREII